MFFDVENVPQSWCNDIPFTQEDLLNILLLKVAGCTCDLPLLGETCAGRGKELYVPRCRVCNTEIRIDH
jgi:hypothetical protein